MLADADAAARTETFAALLHLAHGATLRIPPELLVRHVLAVTREGDWAVRRAAMEALLRRVAAVKRDALRVNSGPRDGSPFGPYRTRRARRADRPYATWLESLRPLRGSCDCPDYLRSSLGLCKHILTVVDHLASRARRFERALAMRPVCTGQRIVWDPVRPLTGRGDWLARVWWIGFAADSVRGSALSRALRWFEPAPGGSRVSRAPGEEYPEERAAMVEDLLHIAAGPAARGAACIPAEPALHALLVTERSRLARITRDRADRGMLGRDLRSMRRRLYPYQVEGVRRFLDTGRLLLADDLGLGKTVQAIAACHVLWRRGKVRRGLLIVPASLKSQWRREWQLFTDAPLRVVEGNADARLIAYRCRRGFLVVNYEQVLRDLPALQAWAPGLVVLDEAQRIKNWATRTAACVKQLQPEYRLVLTGTPMENRLEELASIVEWVDDHALEPKWRLVPWHSLWADGIREASGARNLETLRSRLAPCMLRRVRAEIARQLPPRTDTTIPVELTEDQRSEHDALNRPIAQLVAIRNKRPLTQAEFLKLMRLLTAQRMIANGLAQIRFLDVWPRLVSGTRPEPAVLQSLHSPKLLELREILAQVVIQQQRKVVVFSQWRRMLALAEWAVRDLLEENHLRAAFFTGLENQRQRARNIVEFHDDPRLRVLFATDSGGVGLNLQRAASCCVNIELAWNPAVLEQRIGRIFRPGQKRPIDVYNLVGQDCIEARLATLVADKRAVFVGLFDGRSDEVRFERSTSFLANVERLLPSGAMERRRPEERVTETESVTDAAAQREIETLLAETDESRDRRPKEVPAVAASTLAPLREAARVAAPPPAPARQIGPGDVRYLFERLEIESTPQGGIRIEAPAEAAAALVALLDGLAGVLRARDSSSASGEG